MTKNKARKRLVRQRSAKTGESYAAALRQLLASKETPMATPEPTTTTPPRSCTCCGEPESSERRLLLAGVPICRPCDERFRAVFRTHLEPAADSVSRPLDHAMTALVYTRRDDRWYLHLHSFLPGLVIGRRGATAQAIHDDLVAMTGDDRLHLNIVEHGHPGCSKKPDTAES